MVSSTLFKISFLITAISPLLLIHTIQAQCTDPQTIVWDTQSWTNGSLSGTLDQGVYPASLSISDPSNSKSTVAFVQTPATLAFYKGDQSGLALNKTLVWASNLTTLGTTNKVTFTFNFGNETYPAYADVNFKLFDVDGETDPKFARNEKYIITGYLDGVEVSPTLTTPAGTPTAITTVGNQANGVRPVKFNALDPDNGDASPRGVLGVSFSSPVDQVVIEFSITSDLAAFSSTSRPGFGIFDIHFCPPPAVILPIRLYGFHAERNYDSAILRWRSSDLSESVRYQIQASTDSRNFETIGEVSTGDRRADQAYSFVDGSFAARGGIRENVYYRIKEDQGNGESFFTRIIILKKDRAIATIYPNPASDELWIQPQRYGGRLRYKLTGIDGKCYVQENPSVEAGRYRLDLKQLNLKPGPYLLLISQDGVETTKKILIL